MHRILKTPTLFYGWRTWSGWTKWHVQDNVTCGWSGLKTVFVTLSPVPFLLYDFTSNLNPFMQFWDKGVHQNFTGSSLEQSLDRMRDLTIFVIWSCIQEIVGTCLFFKSFIELGKIFWSLKKIPECVMHFLVIFTKSYADLLYIVPVLVCLPLKPVIYMVNVSDMFRNIILKIQTMYLAALTFFFLLEKNIFKWETVPYSKEKGKF